MGLRWLWEVGQIRFHRLSDGNLGFHGWIRVFLVSQRENHMCDGTGAKRSMVCSDSYKFIEERKVSGMEEHLGDKAREVGKFQHLQGF